MFREILIALDGSARSERIVSWARTLVRPGGGRVRLVMACRPAHTVAVQGRTVAYVDQLEAQARAEAVRYLGTMAARLEADGIVAAIEVRFGDPVEVILAAAREAGADVIAMATRGVVGVRRLLARSVTREVLRRAEVPVLIARSRDQRVA
jgi:nucleotide-binding universal stress UspA family protein